MHAALRTCEENLKQFKLKFDRLTTEIEELYGFDGTKQLNIILSSVREKTMRDLERTVFISGLFLVLLSASLDCLPMKKTFLLLSILLFCVF
jgi:hypothetical protein